MFTVGEGILGRKDFLERLINLVDSFDVVTNNKGITYYNIPAGFDIENSSFYEGGEEPENKRGIMYLWQFGIYNLVTVGREWAEFFQLLDIVKKILNLSDSNRLVVYVHNLPHEFQFIRKRFNWQEVFLLSDRKPVYCTSDGIEFRCSLKLSGGKSLDAVGKDLVKYKVLKKTGQLDYNKIRTPLTPLTEEELEYGEFDIRVILCYIQEKIEMDGDITKIPLTNTGYVRNYCRKSCYRRWKAYRRIMSELIISPEEYSQLKRAFLGGFVHGSARYIRKLLSYVGSHDFTSSYPAVMVLEKFPMSRSKLIDHKMDMKELSHMLHTYCCLFELEIINVVPKLNQEHPISRSKCYVAQNCVVDNGRIVAASRVQLTVTEQDFFVYQEFYSWEEMNISNFRYYEKGYLPKQFVESVLEIYKDKTTLKGVDEEFIRYMISKNMLNATFGMTVTDPVREVLEYKEDVFTKKQGDIEKEIEKYNNNKKRFLYYPWGVWITAYARANLFSAIIEMGDDYVYADTDSVKTLNTERHKEYFERYNQEIMRKIEASAKHFGFPLSMYSPTTIKGEIKTIGFWDDEGVYDKFKTLGAKRYLIEKGGKRVLTMAGVNKKEAMKYLEKTERPFESFDHNLIIPSEYTKRLSVTYIDQPTHGFVIDMYGVPYEYDELSSVHMEPTSYNLTMSDEFIRYLEGYIDFGE